MLPLLLAIQATPAADFPNPTTPDRKAVVLLIGQPLTDARRLLQQFAQIRTKTATLDQILNRTPLRIAWHRHANALYGDTPNLRYTGLDPQAHYKVRYIQPGQPKRPANP